MTSTARSGASSGKTGCRKRSSLPAATKLTSGALVAAGKDVQQVGSEDIAEVPLFDKLPEEADEARNDALVSESRGAHAHLSIDNLVLVAIPREPEELLIRDRGARRGH